MFTLFSLLAAIQLIMDPRPSLVLPNSEPSYSLINSVDFQPGDNLFCATYTHNNKILFYKMDGTYVHLTGYLSNPNSKLSEPQHAAFSPDGHSLAVANWTSQTLLIYRMDERGLFSEPPAGGFSFAYLGHYRPHGIAFSPCGHLLAVAFGAAYNHGRAIALFKVSKNFKLISILKEKDLSGIPKGITFSPDGSSLLVTFGEPSSLAIFDIREEAICLPARQTIQGPEARISRPEDVKISPCGRYCAVSNSDLHTVSFYPFDSAANRVTETPPCYVLQNPEAEFYFPHGLAFSPDGAYLAVTQFGHVETDATGNISWGKQTSPAEAKITLYRLTYQ